MGFHSSGLEGVVVFKRNPGASKCRAARNWETTFWELRVQSLCAKLTGIVSPFFP